MIVLAELTPEGNITITLSCLVGILGLMYKISSRVAKTELKVDTMWDLHIRQQMVSGVKNDTLKFNSPIRATTKGYEWFTPYMDKLKEWYLSGDIRNLSDRELYIALDRKFGAEFSVDLALTKDTHLGELIAVALAICRDFDRKPTPETKPCS